MFEALVHVGFRAMLATLVAVVAPVVAMVVDYFGYAPAAFGVAAFVVFTAIGWALLPGIRHSRALGVVAAIAWLGLGAFVWTVGGRPGPGWMVAPWAAATLVVVLLLRLPRKHAQREEHNAAGSDHAELPGNELASGDGAKTERP